MAILRFGEAQKSQNLELFIKFVIYNVFIYFVFYTTKTKPCFIIWMHLWKEIKIINGRLRLTTKKRAWILSKYKMRWEHCPANINYVLQLVKDTNNYATYLSNQVNMLSIYKSKLYFFYYINLNYVTIDYTSLHCY